MKLGVEMPLTDRNANFVGTHFGGSLYSMVDPHLMVLLIHRLGPDYVVRDKEANIDKSPAWVLVRHDPHYRRSGRDRPQDPLRAAETQDLTKSLKKLRK